MAIEIVTGYQGKNHVTANDIGGFQQGVVGVKDYVLGVGEKAKATLVSNNTVRINDGELVMQGVHWRIKPGTYENVTINNGSQGQKRKDAIVARYTKNSASGIENIVLAVLQGAATTGTPVAPVPTKGDIRVGALKHEMLLYTVELNGLNVVGVNPAFDILMSMKELQDEVTELNSNISNKAVRANISKSTSLYGYAILKNNRVTIQSRFSSLSVTETSNTWHTLAILDEQYRPEYEVYAVATYGGSQNYITSVRLLPTGAFQIYVRSGTVQYMTYNFTYYTETNYLNQS